jgi:branched-subunit amino acid transport protein
MNIYIYIAVMAVTTYLIRMLPMVIFKKEIKNRYLRSFFYYVPCACLAAMTLPSMVFATASIWSGLAGLTVAAALALFGRSLVTVAAGSCATVFIAELIIKYLA